MTQSEESITLVTSYRLPHYGSRSFFGTLNDDQVSCHYDDFFRRLGNAGKTVRMICTGARLFPK